MKTKPTSKPKKRTAKCSNDDLCDSAIPTPPQRRSIPVAEVAELIQEARQEIKAQRTIYDDRLDCLDNLADNTHCIEHHEQCLHNAKLHQQSLRKELERIDLAIRRELELSR